ncbi:GP88 family protein [Embleya sp. NPDC055664]
MSSLTGLGRSPRNGPTGNAGSECGRPAALTDPTSQLAGAQNGNTGVTAVGNSASSDSRVYQQNGTYTWPVVLARHQRNLLMVLDELPRWEQAMTTELGAIRFRGAWVRIHDSGDFFSDAYLMAWLKVMRERPDTNFYAYTKEIARFRALVEPAAPANFLWVYSFGGTQDAALDPDEDRVADVFPDEEAIEAAGWHSQEASDLLAVLGPRLVGIPANRIPHYLKRLQRRTFRSWQAEVDAERRERAQHRLLRAASSEGRGSESRDHLSSRRAPERLDADGHGQPGSGR